jgi:hypothetical protein
MYHQIIVHKAVEIQNPQQYRGRVGSEIAGTDPRGWILVPEDPHGTGSRLGHGPLVTISEIIALML